MICETYGCSGEQQEVHLGSPICGLYGFLYGPISYESCFGADRARIPS
ncbi:hypothetical protein [Peribacillus butanolivorans]